MLQLSGSGSYVPDFHEGLRKGCDSCRMTQTEREKRFEDVYQDSWPAVFRYALRRTSSYADAQDVVVETFMTLWRHLDDVQDPALPWLFGVARRAVANRLRQRGREKSVLARISETIVVAASEDPPDGDDDLDGLFRALRRLKEDDREVLLLVAWEGLSHEEAGRALGCSRNAFTKRFMKAKSRLEALMQ